MGNYSIKELEQLSGIKAHTIRIWKKRHKIIAPSRPTTNIRLYSDNDLKKIINVSLLNNSGIKISHIADMTTEEINHKVLEIFNKGSEASIHIDQLVLAMIDMEEEQFERTLSNLILRYNFERAITEVVYPFLDKIGILWQTGNITPAHEHFISNLVRQKIIVAIDGLPIPPKTADKIILFLPEGEMHEIGLLFYHYLTRKAGLRTYYLGQSVPHNDLISIHNVHQPVLMITSITSIPAIPVPEYFKTLSRDFPNTRILAAGMQVLPYAGQAFDTVTTFNTALELIPML